MKVNFSRVVVTILLAQEAGARGIRANSKGVDMSGDEETSWTRFVQESYQSEALRRTEEQVGATSFSDAKLVQYFSLYCIYSATNGVPNDITNDDPRFDDIAVPNWLFDDNWDATNVDPCSETWRPKVKCNSDRVTEIDLSSNFLTGVFPPEVSLLASDNPSNAGNLRSLVLFKNEFLYNNMDNSWISNLGPRNLFCRKSPKNARLNNLNYVVISGLSLSSSIPTVFGSLQNLEFFYAADSLITGDLSFMEGMPVMKQLWVDDNPGLGGPLYPFIGDIESMISLSLTDNSLTGTIPAELGKLTDADAIWLFGNSLTGTIPSEIGNLRFLRFFQVEGNQLSGEVPDEICANTQFPSEVLEVLGADCSEVTL
eukprot:scaffold721_cov131-Cylindrotheca_fusiformis.AAC.72